MDLKEEEKMECQMKKERELNVKERWHRPIGVRAGCRNEPTQKETEEHEATHVPFRDWCAHCMVGRTHHHVAQQ